VHAAAIGSKAFGDAEPIGRLPLLDQPGTRWRYNTGATVAGVLIERAAGAPLPEVLRERVFEPLGMADTGFWVPAAKRNRFTTFYAPGPDGELRVLDRPDPAGPANGHAGPAIPGGFGWDGGSGTAWRTDPETGLTGILLTQRMMDLAAAHRRRQGLLGRRVCGRRRLSGRRQPGLAAGQRPQLLLKLN
jgi:CubicO group peptidase (beta-lactamase class C family)